ncbi:sulfite exporter TauE/SafE family protein [Sphingopyxis alaskensis]|uniref:sulfite exporter TauE/SafE family protein n=1 Tax=Sphingopyxis alaskensis TaxID=117207 RepID=UPI0019B80212|nr:sulfite exporter TauE/SafE family protein [Sphingopyxis terrae]MCM3420207.1 sulfite exporter TauE/SafE family protein [Sphingopyxis alaskensis]
MIDTLHYALGGVSGVLVGFVLGLVGGGGSILAVPLLLYLVGVKEPHVAIGTSAFAVAANAAIGLWNHGRAGTVNWRCGFIYAAAGVVGAFGGSTLGKSIDGHKLLLLFALLMIAVAILMFRQRGDVGVEGARCSRENVVKVGGYGLGTGVFSGFFGIGGGFLIVPGLVAATSMPILRAIGTSLIAVTAFGLTTSLNYALSGLVNWPLAGIFILGGVVGSGLGTRASTALSADKGKLNTVFAGFVMIVAFYMLWKSWAEIGL